MFYWQINALLYEDADVETFVPALSEAAQNGMERLRVRWGRGNGFGSARQTTADPEMRAAEVPASSAICRGRAVSNN